ncbi:copper homeostasis protein CutC [Aurantibacillus circumpalustris]|uniref:copper homeostasis protein CutC n=1 Tax=Aurantibacillus circumpalustris TaxID=3036359 RepID=UPI00295BDD8E|nr:copper homeostasis protein CutC [Aurantibacillus circumpalustris]
MSTPKLLEIACFNLESALIAEKAGADRIEFCIDYEVGGISPPIDLILEAREKIKIPVYVMVRQREGNFVYSEIEIQWMIQYVLFCATHGINGIVFGALTGENEIDLKTCVRLIEAAGNMSITFHRAIDECVNREGSINQLISLGINKILTSGGQKDALSGLEKIKKLQSTFGKKIIIMPGGGLRSENIKLLMDSGCSEFHSSALEKNSFIADAKEIQTLKQLLT